MTDSDTRKKKTKVSEILCVKVHKALPLRRASLATSDRRGGKVALENSTVFVA